MLGGILSALHVLILSLQQPYEVSAIISITTTITIIICFIDKLTEYGEVKSFAQGHKEVMVY